MIVLGVDPGARNTGLAVIDAATFNAGPPPLLASYTVTRPADDRPIEAIPRSYLASVNAAIVAALNDFDVKLIGVEGVTRPTGFSKGRVHTLDPGPIIGTALVLGAIIGRTWSVPVYRIPPKGNGHLFPLARYPEPIATKGKGHDKRRHERSAYDVAVMVRQSAPGGRLDA